MFREPSFTSPDDNIDGKRILVFSLILIFLAAQLASGQTAETKISSEITTLEPGKAIERELAGGQKHYYQITFSADQYARLTIGQRGIDLVIREEFPSAETIETDFDPRLNGLEKIELTVRAPGRVTLTVSAKQKNAAKGFYQIKVEEIRAANEKDFALDEARRLNWEATRLWRSDKYDEALPLAKRALEIRQRELGPEHPDVGSSMVTLANQYSDKADYAPAEELYLRGLALKEKALGKDDVSLAVILNNLGLLYKVTGEFTKAEAAYERALKIREKNLEPNHLLVASVLLNLGNLIYNKGDSVRAAAIYQRVLDIRENALGPDHPDVATILNNLGNLYSDSEEDISKSESLYLRALKIREKNFGENNPQVAQTLYNLSLLYAYTGDLAKGLSFSRRALTVFENSLGKDHPLTAIGVNQLATIYKSIGDYEAAESLYQRAIEIRKKTQNDLHPYLGGTFSNLASLHALKGEIEKAISAQARANPIIEFNTALNLSTGSEREKLEYVKSLHQIENKTLTLGFRYAPDSKEAASLSATMILQRKGRVLDSVSDNLNALRRRFNVQDRILLDNLNRITKEMTEFIAGKAENLSSRESLSKIEKLNAEREELETEITRRANGFYERSKPVALADVQAAIPADAALLEFTVYRPASMSVFSGYDRAAPRYAVFVLRSGELKWKDLGEALEINSGVEAFRRALRDPKRKDVEKLGRGLDEKIMKPVRVLLGDAKHLLISPDGELNLIPFEALVDENDKFLIESYSFSYLTSGRDLLRMRTERAPKSKFLVIANPLFGVSAAETAAKTNVRRTASRSITAARDFNGVYFAPLSGTAQEAVSLRKIFPEAEFLTGAQATESALKKITAPQILHIATHGFFLEDDAQNFGAAKLPPLRGLNSAGKMENPLLRSGLALAGANSRSDGTDDGILTALEASGLNLWGTKLVVLSACDTGLGEIKNGEGVYGLRRAFVLAGTESLVMSLWAVSDYVTRELMTNYYKNLKQEMGRGTALRQVQLEMLKKSGRQHPFYWASFIQFGEWANLSGKR